MWVVGNPRKDMNSWTQMTRIMVWEVEDPRISRLFFKKAVQKVLFFGSETWVLTPHMERALGSFQHRVARWITRRKMRSWGSGRWEYPPLAAAMKESFFEDFGV